MSIIIGCFKKLFHSNCHSIQNPDCSNQVSNIYTEMSVINDKSEPSEIQIEIQSIKDPYELRELLRSIIRDTSDFTEKFLLLQKTMSVEKYQENEIEVINQFQKVIQIFSVLDAEYHFLLQYLTERFLEVLKDMLYCQSLMSKGSFELYQLIMVLRVNLLKINQRWMSNPEKGDSIGLLKQTQDELRYISSSVLVEEDSLIKQMHIRTFVNQIITELNQLFKLTLSELAYVKRRTLELNLLLKLQEFYQAMPVMLKENHFLLLYLFDKLQKLIKETLSCDNFRLVTSSEMLQTLAFLNSILTFKKNV